MSILEKEYHTLNEGIPKRKKGAEATEQIGIDTLYSRAGLHLWIGKREKLPKKDWKKYGSKTWFFLRSVHLNREEAKNLIEEITYRLF